MIFKHPVFILLTSLQIIVSPAAYAEQQWIDVHFHIVGDEGKDAGFESAAQYAIGIMDDMHMDKVIIMPPPRPFKSFDAETLRKVATKYSSRISFVAGGGSLNPMIQETTHSGILTDETKKQFEEIAEKIIASGAKGFGEITAHHVSLNAGHGYESTPADHPLLLMLTDIAARLNVPIDFHFDPIPEDVDKPSSLTSPKNPARFKENVTAFERLLAHNRKARIVWAHAGSDPVGFYTPDLVERLMEKHDNLFCSIRTTHRDNNPMFHPHPRHGGINDDWINLLEKFPDRFVMGTDSFVVAPDYTGPTGPVMLSQKSQIQRIGVNKVLSHLDRDLAKKIGRENAIRIYNLDD